MKNFKFEKVSNKLTKEEMESIKAGLNVPRTGATDSTGQSYYNGAWGKDGNKDTYSFSWYGSVPPTTTYGR